MDDTMLPPISQSLASRFDVHIAKEDGFQKGMKVVAAVFSALLAVVIWIMLDRNADFKVMQASINQHSIQINETLGLIKAVVDEQTRDGARLENYVRSADATMMENTRKIEEMRGQFRGK